MGSVFKRTSTKPLPIGAELFTRKGERFARWKSAKGKTKTAPVVVPSEGTFAGQERIVVETPTYTAKYRDGSGHIQTIATGCRDEAAARAVLAELEKRAELIKARVITPEQDNVANQQDVPFLEHVEAFLNRRTKRAPNGVSEMRQANERAHLTTLANECGFKLLSDLRADSLDGWMRDRLAESMSPANINEFRQDAVSFANWCIRNKRLLVNPFKGVEKLDATANPQRKRRSMTEAELVTLLRVARWRPLAEFGRRPIPVKKKEGESQAQLAKKSKAKKWTYAPLTLADLESVVERGRERLKKNPQHIAKLDRLGRERALIFKTLVLTGLRKGELASITVGQLELGGPCPHVTLNSADEKNRQGNSLPLRADLAEDLRKWLATLQNERHGASDTNGERIALTFQRDAGDALPLDTPLFRVPTGLVRILNRDLATAGIPKRDERGRTIDVHALRHSFGTLLSKGGVAPRTAQAAMRHSTINLTMNTYTDPKLLDVQSALDALPSLPLTDAPRSKREIAKATGTDDLRASTVTPTVTPAADVSGHSVSLSDHWPTKAALPGSNQWHDGNTVIPSEKAPFAGFANRASRVGMTGFEPAASTSRT